MSRLIKYLFFLLMLINLFRSEPDLLICASLIIPNNWDNVLAKSFTMLSWTDPIQEIIGLKAISGLWIFGRP